MVTIRARANSRGSASKGLHRKRVGAASPNNAFHPTSGNRGESTNQGLLRRSGLARGAGSLLPQAGECGRSAA